MSRKRPLAHTLHLAAILAALLLAALLAGSPLSARAQQGLPPQQTPEPITGAFQLLHGPPPHSFGGGSTEPPRDEMSELERLQLQDEIDRNIAQLTALGRLAPATATAVTFGWPLAPSYNLPDYGYHGVSGFVDHDPAYPDHVMDYTCSDRSYDLSSGYNHAGTDFFIAPFPWLKMARDEVSIVAAAPGVIVYRVDGNYDKNCSISGETWNAVSIRHADGTVASYGHMKRGSVTPKQVGDTVEAGEYLGIVGSSGNSTGPHLHFEVRTASRQVLDPFHGSCQPEPSLWAQQPAYYDSAVNAVQTADAPPELSPECAVPGNPHVQDNFSRGDLIHFVTYYRDQLAGQESEYTIYEPNGDVYLRWTHSIRRDHYAWSYWYWDWVLDEEAPSGTWRFEVRFEGKSYETTFNYADPAYLALTAPLAAERWSLGSRQLIRWEDNIGGNVRIDLYAAGSYEATIASNTPSDGEYEWIVPEDLAPASHYRIRVTDLANQVLLDESDEFAITAEPAADFQATPRIGRYPLTVAFEDLSGGEVDSWFWDFGDGNFSAEQNPQHTYPLTGVYKVGLTVSGPLGIDSEAREGYIVVVDGHAVFLPAVGYGAGRDNSYTLPPATPPGK